MDKLGTLGSLGLPAQYGVSPEQELMQGQNISADGEVQALAQQIMAQDPELAMQIMAGNVDPAMLAQLQGTGNDPYLAQMLGAAPSGYAPAMSVMPGQVTTPPDSLRNMLTPPTGVGHIDPATIERVAQALGVNGGDYGDPLSGIDPYHDPQGSDNYSLAQMLGGPAYVV